MAKGEPKSPRKGITQSLAELSAEQRRAALEVSASLAGVSLKVSRAFVAAVPDAAKVLSAEDLRDWGELGRRLAMGSSELGVSFFAEGAAGLTKVPKNARRTVFQICTRQLVLSSSIALESLHLIPRVARDVKDPDLLSRILELCSDIAQRSAKHSADFLLHTPGVGKAISDFGEDSAPVADAVLKLASEFAERTGGLTADLWHELPGALEPITTAEAITLLGAAEEFLEFGGSVTLHFVSSGSRLLRRSPQAFREWRFLARAIAVHGNAVLISFLRATPKFIASVTAKPALQTVSIRRVLETLTNVALVDAESALAAFKSSGTALKKVSVEQFVQWLEAGLAREESDSTRSRRSYFALETRESNERLKKVRLGVPLDGIQMVLRMYIEALTGREVEIAPLSAMPQESRIGDGRTIYLPSSIAEFDEDEKDFKLYKVLAAHGAGQIEFGTFDRDTPELKAAFKELNDLYSMTAEERDSFSLGGYLESADKRPLKKTEDLPPGSDYHTVLAVFPEPRLAKKIFGTMENTRIDQCLRRSYRGLNRDLDLMQSFLRSNRPYIFDLPMHQVPFELLFQITMCGGATDDARQFYGQVVSEIETVLEKFFAVGGDLPTVADSLMATSRVYSLFQNITPEQQHEAESDHSEENSEFAYDDKDAEEAVTQDQVKREQQKNIQDIRELFSAWNSLDDEGEPDDLQGAEAWSQAEVPEQALEADDIAFAYDEWDRELNDYRVGWSRVVEKRVKKGDKNFVDLTRARYRGVISSIRHQFQLMKPENLTRINREYDGEDYDLNALVDFVIDRKADGRQAENIYTKRLRKQRDVAVSLLLDQSSSTARTITRNPLQPYTHPGRRIIEIEKEGLVLMSEALEAVGDVYSINGFTSEGRRNVKFYVVKDFGEKYSDDTERRIGGITFQNNTRLGAAIRHAAHKLLRQESRTKLLIILTDGRPYDHDYGDARYAREDVREALIEAKTNGITPFCITVDRESEAELKDLYGDVGYTIIDDVLSLPERMPAIYRRLTS